jgi:bacillithiol biosynthesis deacetylase BshB1
MMVNKVDFLAVGAHPDDVELGCGGTLIRQHGLGDSFAIIDLTLGEMGTRGTVQGRLKEAEEAAVIMGATARENLELEDGWIRADRESKLKLIASIRKFRPDIVIGTAVHDRHPDHGNASRLIEEAAFLAGLSKISTEMDGVEQEAWRPRLVLHYIQDRFIEPDIIVDITDQMDLKMKAILAHKSQFYDPNSDEPDTYIASKGFLDNIPARAKELGRPCGFNYGEAFTVSKWLGVKDIKSLF